MIEIENIVKQLELIDSKEPELAKAIESVISHIHSTYSDKYAKGIDVIDTKTFLYGKDGAILNTYQVARYLQRYNTTGSAKSGLVKDIMKGIHYLIFELTRRIKNNTFDEKEPSV